MTGNCFSKPTGEEDAEDHHGEDQRGGDRDGGSGAQDNNGNR